MPDHRKLLLISVMVFTAMLFVEHFAIYVALSDLMPRARLSLTGLFLLISYWMLFYVLFKKMLKQDEDNKISIGYLIAFGCLVVLFSQVIFQSYQQTTISEVINEDRIRFFLTGVLGSTALAGLFALIVALDLKLKKRWVTALAIVVLLCLFYFGSPYFMDLIRGNNN